MITPRQAARAIGDKVWFELGDERLPAVVTGLGEHKGQPVVDLVVEGATDKFERNRWAYLDQLVTR